MPRPRMTESESLVGEPEYWYFFFLLESFLDDFNEYPRLRTMDRLKKKKRNSQES